MAQRLFLGGPVLVESSRKPQRMIHVRIDDRYATFRPPYPREEIREFLSFTKPGVRFAWQVRSGLWDGKTRMLRGHYIPVGLFLGQKEVMEKQLRVEFQIEDHRKTISWKPLPEALREKAGKRPFQLKCLEQLHRQGRGLVLSATGSGKTFVAGMLFATTPGTACFVVDELTLLKQTRESLAETLGEPVGMVGKGEFQPQRITVATIQTLHRHRTQKDFQKWFKNLQVLVIDELHLQLNRRNFDVVRTIAPPAVFGLTATLQIQKPHILMPAQAVAGPVIFEYPIRQGIEERVLSPVVVIGVDRSYPTQYQKWEHNYETHIVKGRARNDLIEALVRESIGRRHPTILIVERLDHLEIFAHRLEDVPHQLAFGKVDQEERSRACRKMDAGKLPLIIANRVFSKGIDIQRLAVTIDATGWGSENSALQRLGRGTRQREGKTGLIHFDIGDLGPGNHFQRATTSRRRAFRKAGLPMKNYPWLGKAGEILDLAERELQKEANRLSGHQAALERLFPPATKRLAS